MAETESLIDLITLLFQALLGVSAIVLAGWYSGLQGKSIVRAGQQILLPALAFSTLAASPTLTWKRLLQQWPAIIIALASHLPSILFGKACTRLGGSAGWMAEIVSFNNVSSFPLLLTQLLQLLSTSETALGHLRWRSLDTVAAVSRRATEYIVLNLLIVTAARALLQRFVTPSTLRDRTNISSDSGEANDDSADDTSPSASPASERSPLLTHSPLAPRSSLSTSRFRLGTYRSSALGISAVLGLSVGLIKPLQRLIVGTDLNYAYTYVPMGGSGGVGAATASLTGLWKCFGLVLGVAGGAYGVVDLLGQGAVLKAAASKSTTEKQPPVLGPVLLVSFWRFAVVPAISISIVHGFRKIESVAVYLQDPAFSFALALSTISPPFLPSALVPLPPLRANIHLALLLLSPLLCIPLALALAISAAPGRAVSMSTSFDLPAALRRAAGGGLAGALAMVLQVLLLMPLRTVMNYQYRYGGKVGDGVRGMYREGGVKRYYAGMGAALFQGPLARFGDTAANAFILSLLASLTWPVLIKTIAASLSSAAFRMVLTPIDTLKTTQQTQGGEAGWRLLRERVRREGVGCLWWGALATAAATFVGHYPWFGTYNFLSEHLPPAHTQLSSLARQAFIGFAASVASDTISNSLRVVKTYRQVHERDVGYFTAAKEIVHLEGISALFGRGLPVRLLTNGLQGLLFSILWKRFEDGISNSGTAGWAIAISLLAALYLGALIRAILSLETVRAAIGRLLGGRGGGAVRLPEGDE